MPAFLQQPLASLSVVLERLRELQWSEAWPMARPEVPRRIAAVPPTDSLAQHSAGNPAAAAESPD